MEISLTSFTLADLLQPIDTATFFDQYWEKQPILVQGTDAHRFSGLFSLTDVDHLFATPALIHSSSVRVIRDGRGLSLDQIALRGLRGDHGTVEALLGEHRTGATIALQALNRIYPSLRDLCGTLAKELSATFQVNAYLTPPSSQGFDTHFDTHDVFILQIAGIKRWNVFAAPVALPMQMTKPREDDSLDTGSRLLDVELRPGDLMYIPRGFPHHAVSAHSTSLHLTVGVHTITWAAVMRAALDAKVEHDARFRASLPPGFATSEATRQGAIDRFNELITSLANTGDGRAVIDDAAQLARQGQGTVLPGRFLDIASASEIDSQSRVRRRSEVGCEMTLDGDHLRLYFNGKSVTVPAFAGSEVRHLLAVDECRPADLPGEVDDEGRLVLVRTLIREGLLTICR